MQYRPFGKLDWQVSALGFGAMRLPTTDDNPANIDAPLSIHMIRTAIDGGVNYVDTAYFYHGGQSEVLMGKALKDGYREKVKLATKLPARLVEKPDDFDRFLDLQLERLAENHIDVYLLHGMNKVRWPILRDMDIFSLAEKAVADGRIGHLGFSFHDEVSVFKEIVDGYDNWAMCQIQYNYMDTEYQAGTEGLRYAADKGLAVVIMEPIRGGALAKTPPPPVAKLFDRMPEKRSPAEWALQWVWHQPEVALALSGMSTMDHVKENLASADRSGVGVLSAAEMEIMGQVTTAYRELGPVPCTACRYCMPCPNNVNIPEIFGIYNDATMYQDVNRAKRLYQIRVAEEARADHCVACGDCLELCPQAIPIPDWMEKADSLLGS